MFALSELCHPGTNFLKLSMHDYNGNFTSKAIFYKMVQIYRIRKLLTHRMLRNWYPSVCFFLFHGGKGLQGLFLQLLILIKLL